MSNITENLDDCRPSHSPSQKCKSPSVLVWDILYYCSLRCYFAQAIIAIPITNSNLNLNTHNSKALQHKLWIVGEQFKKNYDQKVCPCTPSCCLKWPDHACPSRCWHGHFQFKKVKIVLFHYAHERLTNKHEEKWKKSIINSVWD
jgi:hypothetical protein